MPTANSEVFASVHNVTVNSTNSTSVGRNILLGSARFQIPFYTIILLLAIIGNILVISTLVQNRRMRTITNLFLLNLAVSDILLGVLCMPFTLVGTLLRDFVFGEVLCKLIPYLQATSVAVSSWTLVAISCERYYAICHPLRSRAWQTLRHAYKIIAFIWTGSLLCMLPIAMLSTLIPTSTGHRKCREEWPDEPIYYERAYNLFLDLILLVFPLVVLCATYFLITKTLWHGIRAENFSKDGGAFNRSMAGNVMAATTASSEDNTSTNNANYDNQFSEVYLNTTTLTSTRTTPIRSFTSGMKSPHPATPPPGYTLRKQFEATLRRSNVTKNLQNKQRVIKMLFVLVLEFFICWTPLYVINTIALFSPKFVYRNLGYTAISYFQLLAYSSSCCNPITYCFMNASFRKAFLDTFRGLRRRKRRSLAKAEICDGDSLKIELNRN